MGKDNSELPNIPAKHVELVYMTDGDSFFGEYVMPIIHNENGNKVKNVITDDIFVSGEKAYEQIANSFHVSMPEILTRILADTKLSIIPIIKSQLLRDFVSFAEAVGYQPPYNTEMVNSFINLKLVTAQDMEEFCSPLVSMSYVKQARAERIREMNNPENSEYEQVVREMKKF